MKVLWITNSPLDGAYKKYNKDIPVTGGWFRSAAISLVDTHKDIELANVSLFECSEFQNFSDSKFKYYLIPLKGTKLKYKDNLITYWKLIMEDFKPDIVHIHGSEYPHSLSFVKSNNFKNTIVSIQGLVSVYHRYFLGGLSQSEVLKVSTLRDFFRKDTLFHQLNSFKKRGSFEKELLSRVQHVIGRTSWDYAHAWSLNNKINYHFCNETLRNAFYKNKWDSTKCQPFRIFLSQSHYPIKGLHQMLRALPIILKIYPQTKIHVAGGDITKTPAWRLNGYGRFIKNLIKEYKLSQHITFTGRLNEQEMCDQYLKSNVFVCPSSIENSPNSLGEAQLLGVPTVSSYVGGVPDMVMHEVDGLMYRFEEHEMLAQNVCRIFSDSKLALKLSENGREKALLRHSPEKNIDDLIKIYKSILDLA